MTCMWYVCGMTCMWYVCGLTCMWYVCDVCMWYVFGMYVTRVCYFTIVFIGS